MNKTIVTVTLNDKESKLLNELANKKGLSVEALIKQAARFYQTLEVKLEQGSISQNQIDQLFDDGLPRGCRSGE